jgi:hypothetical protein
MPFPIGILLATLAKKGLWTPSLILMVIYGSRMTKHVTSIYKE